MKSAVLRLTFTCLIAFTLFAANLLHAQDIIGDWQGTLGEGDHKLRVILQIEHGDNAPFKGRAYSIDQTTLSMAFTAVSFHDGILTFTIDDVHASYEGKLDSSGNTITGTFTQGKPAPLNFERATPATAWQIDPSPHKVQFIPVDKDVKLEVLDWGGTGRPLVLLTGLGDSAHVWDKFVPKLAANYHVYGITRRGFGASSVPTPTGTNYTADRLGDDVLAVIDALNLSRPVLAGHSIAGEELSSIGTRHPEKISALIYLDAGYPYALYDPINGNMLLDASRLRDQLNQIFTKPPSDQKKFLEDLIASTDRFQKDLDQQQKDMQAVPPQTPPPNRPSPPPPTTAIIAGEQRYTAIKNVPILAIFAVPHDLGNTMKDKPEIRTAMESIDQRNVGNQANLFEAVGPNVKVVRLPHANHYVFRSNEADVLREMNAFIAALPN